MTDISIRDLRTLFVERADRVVAGDLSELQPLELIVRGESVSARVYRRYNRTQVLAIDVFVDEVELEPEITRWVATRSGVMPFAALRVDRPFPGQPGASSLLVSHALVAGSVDGPTLDEVLDGMTYMARRARSRLDELLTGLGADEGDPLVGSAVAVDPRPSHLTSDEPVDDTPDIDGLHDDDAPPVRRTPAVRSKEAILAELDGLIGLAPVKSLIADLIRVQELEELRRGRGLTAATPSPHLVFVGQPGTGKTTVARLVGELYRAIGLLPSGHLVETDRSGLIAGYLGQTALKTRAVCEKALGGVLFIDEAYSLVTDSHGYGQEAIDTLLAFMENNRGRFALVVAGYPGRMDAFLESNPGLRSRFDLTIPFPDYSADELEQIFLAVAASHDYSLTDDAKVALRRHLTALPRHDGFGNGREVRRLFTNVVRRHAAALSSQTSLPPGALTHIPASAIPPPVATQTVGPQQHPGYL